MSTIFIRPLLHAASTALLALLLASCSEKNEFNLLVKHLENEEIAVQRCARDVLWAPVENSGNCIAYVRLARSSKLFEYCGESEFINCKLLTHRSDFYYGMYWRAVAMSLADYGMPQRFKKVDREKIGHAFQYIDHEIMAQAYQDCLKIERAERKAQLRPPVLDEPVRSRRILSITPPLGPGQKCIREGYAEPFQEGTT